MTLELVIAPAAKVDIARIYEYGKATWGKQQADAYLAHLENTLWLLAEQPDMGIARDELATGLRSFPVRQHIVFYRRQHEQLQIARALHGSQDPTRHAMQDSQNTIE